MNAEKTAEPSISGKEVQRILFYDGDCGLCTNTIKFFLKIDRKHILHFAPLQGETSAERLPQELRDASDLSTVVYWTRQDGEPMLRTRSGAVAAVLIDIGGFWGFLGRLLRLVPECIREPGYRLVARHRMKFFPGGACRLPTQEEAKRLLN